MTATTPDIAQPTAAAALPSKAADTRIWIGTMAIILVGYLLLQNPYWVPSGDSEVYIATARNIATGKGNTFNGFPAILNPPGWPLLMAGLMRISPTFLFLKLVNMGMMVASLGLAYRICRRFATPMQSSAAVLLAAIVSNVYQCSFWLISESSFCLASVTAILLAMQVAEGRDWRWRTPLLVALCAGSIVIRWAGVFTCMLVIASLIDGRLRPKLDRYWIAAVACGIVSMATFLTLRATLRLSPEDLAKSTEFGGSGEEAATETPDAAVATPVAIVNRPIGGVMGYVQRALTWGDWISYFFWQPFRIGAGGGHIARWLDRGALAAGWALLLSILIRGLRGLIDGRWFFPAIVAYSFALAMMWTHPNARYLVPIAPFLVLGIFQGVEAVVTRWPTARMRRDCTALVALFVAGVLLCNGALYAVEVWVERSGNFYARYEAGLDADLISAARWLRDQDLKDGQIAVSPHYVNYGKARSTPFGLRVINMLTDRAIVKIDEHYLRAGDPSGRRIFLDWARDVKVKYYLYQPEVSPWRVFHFRMGWLQEMMTHQPAEEKNSGWQLWEIPPRGNRAVRIPLEPSSNWPTRVPGM